MFIRPLGQGIVQNPLVDSPYIQQNNIGIGSSPPAGNNFLLLNGSPMLLLNGNNLGLL